LKRGLIITGTMIHHHRLWSYFHRGFKSVWCHCGVDKVNQATIKSSQDWGPVMYSKPSVSSAAINSNADRWRSSHPYRTSATTVSISTVTFPCGRMFSEQRRAALLPSVTNDRSVNWYRRPHSKRWRSLLSTNSWITGTARWSAFQLTSCADFSQLWTLQHGSSSTSGAPITSRMHSSVYIGCVYRSESNSISPCWHT